jgi:UrcA family protein
MNSDASSNQVAVSRPRITLMMVLCGIVSAVSAGAASAATPTDDDVPRIVVQYDSASLATESGARSLYHRLERAAEQVCAAGSVDRPFLRSAVKQCREQSIARAVLQIDNPHLAAVYATSTKRG